MKNNYIDFSDHFGSNGPNAYFSLCDQDYSSINNRKGFVENLGYNPSNLVIPNQVHSDKIKLVDNPCLIEDIDGIITKNKSLVLSVLDNLTILKNVKNFKDFKVFKMFMLFACFC